MNTSASQITALFAFTLALAFGCLSQAADINNAPNNNVVDQGVETQANGPAAKKNASAVAAAFRLPSGTVLNKKQRAALNQLKTDNEADLQQAFVAMAQAKTAAERAKALQDIRETRATIRTGLDNILAINAGASNSSETNEYAANQAAYDGAAPYYYLDAGYNGWPYGRGWYGNNYGKWANRPNHDGPPPYYYNGKYYGTVNRPVATTKVSQRPAGRAAKHH